MARRIRFTRDEAERAVSEARSYSEALRRLNLRPAGGNFRTLQKYVALWGISVDHFDPNWATRSRNSATRTPLADVLVEGSTYNRGHLKRRLFDEGLKQRACEECGQGETWRGRQMALILDHVNGIANDNRLENLRIVCPNCAATLDTHCGRANRRSPVERCCERCGQSFRVKYATHRYCSQACGTRAPRAQRGVPCPERRKVERPPLGELLASVEREGYRATGRRYGVSDNAVRKWLRFYEREQERRCAQAGRAGAGGGSRG